MHTHTDVAASRVQCHPQRTVLITTITQPLSLIHRYIHTDKPERQFGNVASLVGRDDVVDAQATIGVHSGSGQVEVCDATDEV